MAPTTTGGLPMPDDDVTPERVRDLAKLGDAIRLTRAQLRDLHAAMLIRSRAGGDCTALARLAAASEQRLERMEREQEALLRGRR